MRSPILFSWILAALPASALAAGTLEVTSPVVVNNKPIPSAYTCDGTNMSPPLSWSKVPAGTKSFAVLVTDPDAPNGTFTHWLVTGLPPATRTLARSAALPAGAIEAKNDTGSTGYTGPCPPSGRHRYQFQVFALDIAMPKAASRADFLASIKGHVLAKGELVATYEKEANR